jgi:ferredoxin
MAGVLRTLEPLVVALRADGYRVVGPTVRDEAIVFAELDSAGELPQSWQSYLHPPRTPLWTMRRDGFEVTEPDPVPARYAFLGVRPCDLRAIVVQDRVLGGVDGGYERLLDRLPGEPAPHDTVDRARAAVVDAATRMGRTLPAADPRCLLAGTRWLRWDSCFDLDFSYLHGGPVRPSTRSRYRQWLTHKLGTWHDQFGESGCVGCGRCIVWCPVGIDITEEVAALATEPRRE